VRMLISSIVLGMTVAVPLPDSWAPAAYYAAAPLVSTYGRASVIRKAGNLHKSGVVCTTYGLLRTNFGDGTYEEQDLSHI